MELIVENELKAIASEGVFGENSDLVFMK